MAYFSRVRAQCSILAALHGAEVLFKSHGQYLGLKLITYVIHRERMA